MTSSKIILLCLALAVASVITTLVTNLNYNSYVETNNSAMIKIIDEALKGQIEEEEIIEILEETGEEAQETLTKYGYDSEELFFVEENKSTLKKNIVTNILVVDGVILMIFGVFIILERRRICEYEKIVEYINEISQKNYKLEIETTRDGELSGLKVELYKVTLALREQAETLKEEKRLLKDNLIDISHQLKTPLTSINIMLDNIIDESEMDKEVRKEFLEDIRKKTDKIEFLIYNLLKISKFDAGVITFKRNKIQADKLIKEALENVDYLRKSLNIQVEYEEKEKIVFEGDYNWQLEAITNILKNAMEHSRREGKVEISIQENAFYVKIVIRDFGRGISKDKIGKIFNRFYRDEFSGENSIGVGLNLAKMIINKDEGIVAVDSKLGEGTIFEIKYFKRQ